MIDEKNERLIELLRRALADPGSVSQSAMARALQDEAADGLLLARLCPAAPRGFDRRCSARLPVGFHARLRRGGRLYHALVTDVGVGGLQVRFGGCPPRPGDEPVTVEFSDAEGCALSGRFSWIKGGRWGTSAGICLAQESAAVWLASLREAAGGRVASC